MRLPYPHIYAELRRIPIPRTRVNRAESYTLMNATTGEGVVLIYFAGPLFSEAERVFNLRITERLERANYEVFLPQRDGVERDNPPYDQMKADERRRAMFELDKRKIFESDVFLFVLDGRVPDEGACVELGLAHAHKELRGTKKLLVGLQTDSRAAFLGSKLNPMLRVPLERVVEAEDELVKVLEDYRSTRMAM